MKRKRAMRTAAAMILSVAAAACLEDVTGTRPLTLDLDADVSTTTVGEEVTFTFAATGTRLTSVTLDFGDGGAETKAYAGGAVEVNDFAVHAYESAGTYDVVGRALDSQGAVEDTLTITVN
jgi:PKD repeat protein